MADNDDPCPVGHRPSWPTMYDAYAELADIWAPTVPVIAHLAFGQCPACSAYHLAASAVGWPATEPDAWPHHCGYAATILGATHAFAAYMLEIRDGTGTIATGWTDDVRYLPSHDPAMMTFLRSYWPPDIRWALESGPPDIRIDLALRRLAGSGYLVRMFPPGRPALMLPPHGRTWQPSRPTQ